VTDFGPHPGLDSDGDYDPAQDLWGEADDTTWGPEAWRKSPRQMQEECRSANHVDFSMAAAHAHKHDNPPNMPWMRST
jgi:hypothetical protein